MVAEADRSCRLSGLLRTVYYRRDAYADEPTKSMKLKIATIPMVFLEAIIVSPRFCDSIPVRELRALSIRVEPNLIPCSSPTDESSVRQHPQT
jgi:hypothetical protein